MWLRYRPRSLVRHWQCMWLCVLKRFWISNSSPLAQCAGRQLEGQREREKARIPGVSVFVLCTLHASTGQTIRSLSSKCVFWAVFDFFLSFFLLHHIKGERAVQRRGIRDYTHIFARPVGDNPPCEADTWRLRCYKCEASRDPSNQHFTGA